jgi:hypothetical protein
MFGPDTSNPLDVLVVVVATCIWNTLKRQKQNLRQAAAVVPK